MNRSEVTGCVYPFDKLPAQVVAAWVRIQALHAHLASPFFSYQYAETTASVRPHVFVCVLEQRGEVAGLFPFQFQSAAHRHIGAAERMGGELTDHFGVIAPPSLKINSRDLLRAAGLSHFYFTHLDESQLVHGLHCEQAETGLLIDLDGPVSYWERLRTQDKKFVQDTERRARKLEAAYGPLQFHLRKPDPCSSLEHLIERKREQYKSSNVPDALQESWQRELLRRTASSRSESCEGVVSVLTAGGVWVASQLSLRGGPVLHNWFPVYNRELSQFAPGRLLLKCITDAAPGLGISVIDRGAGDTQAKRDFATREQRFYRGVWHRPGVYSTLYRTVCSIRWRLSTAREAKSTPAYTASENLQNA
jgi:CelD/BcsL family acetyltransferase involved in cellulose biosynthesis